MDSVKLWNKGKTRQLDVCFGELFCPFFGHFIAPFISLCDTFIFKAPRDLALIWKKGGKNSNLSCRISLSLYVFYPKMLAHDLMGANFHFFRRLLLLSGSLEVGLHVENC